MRGLGAWWAIFSITWAGVGTDVAVEHVFFRQKGIVHTTRSQWIVGLVLDLKMYEQYLIFTNNTIRRAGEELENGRTYFEKMLRDNQYRTQKIHQLEAQGITREHGEPTQGY